MQKVAHYRRVIWLGENAKNLRRLLDRALDTAQTVASTKFEYRSDFDAQITARHVSDDMTGVYFTLYKEGRRTALVENGGNKVVKRPPPEGEEFLRTGIMMVLMGNHLAYLADGHTNDGQITALLQKFFTHRGLKSSTTQFQLQPKASQKQLKRLLNEGVKSIDLGVTSFSTTIDQLDKKDKKSFWLKPIAGLGQQIQNAIMADRSPNEREAASNIEVKLHLGYDGRGEKGLVGELLGKLAQDIEGNAPEFKIITKNDEIITHDKLVIKKTVNVAGDDVASDYASAFEQLKNALLYWRRIGVLEE